MNSRRRWMLWAVGAYAGILAVVVVGLLLLYRGARDRLDEALGLRLQAVATTAAQLVDGDRIIDWSFDPVAGTDLIWLTSRLEVIHRDNDLAEIALCDTAAFVLISTSQRVAWGDQNVYWDTDRGAVDVASKGFPAVSRLYRSGPIFQKSAHAPIVDIRGHVVAVLTVEGNADFFDALATLRRGALATSAAVLVFLAAMGWLLWRIHGSLERAREDLARQEKLAAMGRMTAGIAHEIRNPLGIIRGAGQHLARVLHDQGIDDETAAFIPEEVDRLDRILTGYLDFGSGGDAATESFDLAALVRRTVQLVDAELRETGVTVEITAPATTTAGDGDPRRLQQVLLNLLLNARDAMPDGGAIAVSVVESQDLLQVSVADGGAGLGDTPVEKLFEPFWSSKPRGSGLGLAVSRQIAREHGGELTLSARTDGPGCTAVLTLPRPKD